MFHIGQKVVCVGTFTHGGYGTEKLPTEGGVYTIRDLIRIDGGELGLRVEEVINPPMQYQQGYVEACFNARFFRPVIERKTDISVFTRILDKVNKRETVNG